MGRFNHEAIAVDAASGAVYETEDRGDGLFYRFLPEEPGRLERGGRLQALCIRGLESADTSNSGEVTIGQGRRYGVDWVDLDDAGSPEDDLRVRGRAKGAATFVRGEGIWSAPGTVFFAATGGGENGSGQIWLYRPGELEGTPGEGAEPATLELFAEPNDTGLLDSPDNLTISPWGDVVICEDGPDGNSVRGVTPAGGLYTLARNAMNDSELTGATFSPDGTTLFVNIQRPGLTLAVTGPWV
jgi:secreted PhoX family phosphatase